MSQQIARRENHPPASQEQKLREVSVSTANKELTTITSKNSYYVGGKRDYDMRVYRQLAQDQGISMSIVSVTKDEQRTTAHVRVWKGPEKEPVAISEAAVVILHKHELQMLIMDAVENGMTVTSGFDEVSGKPTRKKVYPEYTLGTDMFPVLSNAEQILTLMRTHIRECGFLERKAISFAKRNAIRDLIMSDDEEEEIQPEQAAQSSEKKTTEADDVQKLRNQIGMLFFHAAEENREVAIQMFSDFAKTVKGAENARSLKDIASVEVLKAILAAATESLDKKPENNESPILEGETILHSASAE